MGAAAAAAAAGAAVLLLADEVHDVVRPADRAVAEASRRLSIEHVGIAEASTDPRITQSALRAEIIPGSLVTTWRMKIVSPSGSR